MDRWIRSRLSVTGGTLVVKGEYLYTDFGRTTTTSRNLIAYTLPLAFPSNVFTHSLALHGHTLRVGLDYRW